MRGRNTKKEGRGREGKEGSKEEMWKRKQGKKGSEEEWQESERIGRKDVSNGRK